LLAYVGNMRPEPSYYGIGVPPCEKHHPAGFTTGRVLELLTLPPVTRLPGHRPSHEVKCLTVGKRVGSKPTKGEQCQYS